MGSAREAKGCFFWRGRNGGTKSRRAAESKQKHAAPPARRGIPQIAVPAKRRGSEQENGRGNQTGQQQEGITRSPEGPAWRFLRRPAESLRDIAEVKARI